jgi:hypothetical protein
LWATFAALNLGILLRAVFEPLHAWTGVELFAALSGLSGLFLLLAGVAFVVNTWGRVRALGQGQ